MTEKATLFNPVLIVGCAIILVSFAIRASYGVFQIPIAEEFGWLRSEFSLAIAIQNLAWGIGQPIFGALAEKIGDRRAIVIGALVYALGLVLSSQAVTPLAHQTYSWLVGFGIAGTGFGVILAVVARASTDENRSMSLAIITAAGSGGQIVGAPVAEWMLGFLGWQQVFLVFAAAILAMILTLPLMRAPARRETAEMPENMVNDQSPVQNGAFQSKGHIVERLIGLVCHDVLRRQRLNRADQNGPQCQSFHMCAPVMW